MQHSQALGDARVTGVVGEFTQAMIVRASAGGFRHPGGMAGGQRRRKGGGRPGPRQSKRSTILSVLHLHPRNSRMS